MVTSNIRLRFQYIVLEHSSVSECVLYWLRYIVHFRAPEFDSIVYDAESRLNCYSCGNEYI
jgi:hypothetical protein